MGRDLSSFLLPRSLTEWKRLVVILLALLLGTGIYYAFFMQYMYLMRIPIYYNFPITHKNEEANFIILLKERIKTKEFLKDFPRELNLNKDNVSTIIGFEVKDVDSVKTRVDLILTSYDKEYLRRYNKAILNVTIKSFNDWFVLRHENRQSSIYVLYEEAYTKYTSQLGDVLLPLLDKGLKDKELIDTLIKKQSPDTNMLRNYIDFQRKQNLFDEMKGVTGEKFILTPEPYQITTIGKGNKRFVILMLAVIGFAFLLQGVYSSLLWDRNKTKGE